MSSRSIDDIIKEALEKIESDPRTADWGSFESSLDEHELTDMDEFVKSNLEKIQPSSENAWHAFEDRYAEEIDQPHPVDKTVKENLSGHEAYYSESSWYRLSSLLDLTDRRERDLLIRKISEVLTVSLILFILIPQFFIKTNKAKPTVDTQQYAHHQASDKNENNVLQPLSPTKLQGSVTSIENVLTVISPQLSSQSQHGQLFFADLPGSSKSGVSNRAGQSIALTPLKVEQLPILFSKTYSHSLSPNSTIENTTIEDPFSKMHNSGLQPITELGVTSPDFSEISEQPDNALNRLPGLPIFPLMSEEHLRSEIDIIDPQKEKRFSLATIFSPKLTHIYTPYDEVYDNEAYGRLKVFSEFGLALEKRKGDVSIGGSMSYGSMSYRPPVVLEAYGGNIAEINADSIIGGYRSLSLANIDISMASISMFVRNFYPITDQMRWFSHFGGGINMVLTTDYYVQDIIDHSNGTFTERTFEFNTGEASASTDHVKLHQKNFEGGILEGGNFNRNSYMDIELGAGIEYDISNQSSVYIASILNVSPFKDGLGPNRDRVNNLDLKIGFKYWL